MYPGNSELITFCQEMYQINQDLSKKCINFICSDLAHGKCTQVGSFEVTFNQDTLIVQS